ncbi:sortase [Candidatus Oscillochloris fontis]|uniref:sortase n=1 Tax=Candidatus Oscillochloris fontis TaxID=2496868 RepID=UPI00101DD015|nr:sortase [Candidatus Oscillochloris fontis]
MVDRPTISPESSDQALLDTLLTGAVPSRRDQLGPARLLSTSEQQRIALRPFLFRTWLDHVLHLAERSLVITAIVVFGYWFVDGYGRDWLYMLQNASVAESAPAPTPVLRLPDTVPPAVAAELPALPFTTPDMANPPSADFMAPQPVLALPAAADPRPQRMIMASIGVDTPIKEVFIVDGAWQVADYAAGYHHGSALPGHTGNTVLSGHAGLRGGVFRDLGLLRPGDDVQIETGGWSYTYRVRTQRAVWPTQVEVMSPTPNPVLTLITCTNWDTQRLIVVADLISARPRS